MSATITDIRALLIAFEKCGYSALTLEMGDTAVHFARGDGAGSPFLAPAAIAPPPAAEPIAEAAASAVKVPGAAVTAPHIGTFVSALPVGTQVAVGDIVATIRVLDETVAIAAPCHGTVASVSLVPEDLAEYGMTLVTITPA